ncbi:MAG TPA: hypothetical protein VGP72_27425 [Planctomycetota bacterium]|jgi:ABC-type transport system involved in multi-copper enzyme maturation permease subunit
MTALSPFFAFFHLGEEAKMTIDLGMSTILTASTILVLLTASTTITDEIEGRTALTMLSKPLRREEFLIGKYLGIACAGCAFVALMAIVLLTTLRSQRYIGEVQDPNFPLGVGLAVLIGVGLFTVLTTLRLLLNRGLPMVSAFWVAYVSASIFLLVFLGIKAPAQTVWEWRLIPGLISICLHACVVAAVAVALATRLTLVQSAIGTAAFCVLGHASSALVGPFRTSENELTVLGHVLRAILPDLDQFNNTDALATAFIEKPISIPWDVLAGSTIYALLYGIVLMAVASALFSRRELA